MNGQEIPIDKEAALVIIGAGYSGVTALTVARNYIPKPGRIVIADVRSTYGGQWVDAYDFVRLHQPYQTYTCYDQSWKMHKPPDYLASRDEVLSHLQDLADRAGADELFGYRYIGHEKVEGNDDLLEVSFQCVKNEDNFRNQNDWESSRRSKSCDNTLKIRTKLLINSRPVSHRINTPLQLSSSRIHSIDIRGLSADISNNSGELHTHYVIVGSGKSAMDATNYIRDKCNMKDTTVSMIAGNGVAFLPREKLFPVSWYGRHFGGMDIVSVLVEYGTKWNGTNQADLMREMERNGFLISAVPNPSSCIYGLLSQEELEKVKQCVGEIIKGRMIDIVDSDNDDGINVVLEKTGEKVPLQKFRPENRTVVVNCTELTDHENRVRPILQDNGKTLDTQLIVLSPGISTMNLTHAWFLGKLEGDDGILSKLLPLEFISEKHNKEHLFFKNALVGVHNFWVLIENMPLSVMGNDNANPLRWFPLWRQLRTVCKVYFAMPHVREFCQNIFGDIKFPVCKS